MTKIRFIFFSKKDNVTHGTFLFLVVYAELDPDSNKIHLDYLETSRLNVFAVLSSPALLFSIWAWVSVATLPYWTLK